MTDTTECGATTPAQPIISFKGFDANLRCRGFQFEVGGSYEQSGKIKACNNGFHACEHPLNVFDYYPPAGNRFARVLQSGEIARHEDDTKIASGRITIEAELRLPDLIAAAIKYVFDRSKPEGPSATGDQGAASATGYQGAASATGYQGAASATGYQGAASATGDQGAASATGYQGAASATGVRGAASATGVRGAASATGYQGAASATGDQGAASATGVRGAAMACGFGGKVKAAEGNAMFLVYRSSWDGPVEKVWAGIAGQDGIKPDAWYALGADGKPVEAAE